MNRTPPLPVQKKLRSEVNHGCPVPECGSPLLTWHHFDPPWHIKNHHDSAGMIALCNDHHKAADVGTLSNEYLTKLKKQPNEISVIQHKFPWFFSNPLIRLGGCYAVSGVCDVRLSDTPVLRVDRSENGHTEVTLSLRDEQDHLIADLQNNSFSAFTEFIHDVAISCSSNRIKIWHSKRNVGLELHYSEKSIEEIETMLKKDREVCAIPDNLPLRIGINLPPKPIDDIHSFYKKLSLIENYMEVVQINYQQQDPVGTRVRWRAAKCMGENGMVPVLNFISCRLFFNGSSLSFRDGKMGNLQFCAGTKFAFNGKNRMSSFS